MTVQINSIKYSVLRGILNKGLFLESRQRRQDTRAVIEISQNSTIFGEGHEDTILKRCLSIVSPLEIRTLVWKVDHLLRSSGKGKGRG